MNQTFIHWTLAALLSLAPANAGFAAPLATAQQSSETPEAKEANSLSAQVVKLYQEQKYEEALPLAKRALTLRESAFGLDHALVADALQNLALVALGAKKYPEAEEAFGRAITIYEKNIGKENIKLCPLLDRLSAVYVLRGEKDKAEDALTRALMIKEKVYGENHREVVQGLLYLGQFYQQILNHGKAVPFFKRALDAAEKSAGISEKEVADIADLCADALVLNWQANEALTYAQKASAIYEKLGQASDSKADPSIIPTPAGILVGRATFRMEPRYPEDAKRRGITGKVMVEIIVSQTGRVIQARALSGPPALQDAAIEAAIAWRFTPTSVSGKPAVVKGTITFNFNVM